MGGRRRPSGGGGGPPGGPPGGSAHGPSEPNRGRFGKWMMYDEQVHLNGTYRYDSKKPASWLQEVRDYVAGRTRELDQLIDWIEKQKEELINASNNAKKRFSLDPTEKYKLPLSPGHQEQQDLKYFRKSFL